jgi:ferric-dicitrate binding protein FerR (iron transport regulator)
MQENLDSITQLLLKAMDSPLTAEERERLETWIAASAGNRRLWADINDKEQLQASLIAYDQKVTVFNSYTPGAASAVVPIKRSARLKYWYAAAAVLLLATAGTYLFYQHRSATRTVEATQQIVAGDVPPAGPRARLDLADGHTIELDGAANGKLTEQAGITIEKTANGQLLYDTTTNISGNTADLLYNTVTTPKGGTYRIILPDGTRAWLNAASSIRFAVNFPDNYRLIETRGEVYLEVAKDINRPFFVKVLPPQSSDPATLVQVTGTRFNINAYGDQQQTGVTLLEGSVQVKTGITPSQWSLTGRPLRQALLTMKGKLLQPGQRAIIDEKTEQVHLERTNAANAISWVNGEFYFNRATLSEVMKELERWYDIDFAYDRRQVSLSATYKGYIDRTMPLTKVLGRLEQIGDVRFKLTGKTVSVVQP